MVTLTIDQKTIQAAEGTTILEAAEQTESQFQDFAI